MDARFRTFVELFANYPTTQHRLTLLEAAPVNGAPPAEQRQRLGPHPNAGPGHRPSRSGEEERRRAPRARPRRNEPSEELDIFASPEKQRERRARRNSESSVLEKSSLTESERRRRQARHREREARSRDSKADGSSKTREKDGSKADSSKPRRRKPRGMDLIDQLDQTGIYGAGCKFVQILLHPSVFRNASLRCQLGGTAT
jgi:hypothetical protein